MIFQKENETDPEAINLPPISRSPGEIPSLVWKSSETNDSYLTGQQILDLNLISKEKENNLNCYKII